MKCGVYRIRNMINQKSYLGSSIDIPRRWREHRRALNMDQHHSVILQRAWNKYQTNIFIFEVLLYCDEQDCLTYEQLVMNYYTPEYNISNNASAPMMGRRHTDETKRLMSKARSGTKHPSWGLKRSEATRAKFIGENNPFFGKKHSDETLRDMRKNRAGEGHSQTKLTWQDVKEIRQSNEIQRVLAKRYGVTQTAISKIITKRTWNHE